MTDSTLSGLGSKNVQAKKERLEYMCRDLQRQYKEFDPDAAFAYVVGAVGEIGFTEYGNMHHPGATINTAHCQCMIEWNLTESFIRVRFQWEGVTPGCVYNMELAAASHADGDFLVAEAICEHIA